MSEISSGDMKATSIAHPNIAFIKYWGNTDESLRLPANGSISMNLAALETITKVEFTSSAVADRLTLNGNPVQGIQLDRVSSFLDLIRARSGIKLFAEVVSTNNFPSGSGIASSASGFAALALAGSTAAGLHLNENQLSALARRGSGSACRSIPSGFSEWVVGISDESSYAHQLVPQDHWDLVDLILVLDDREKKVGSTTGHSLAGTSILQTSRVNDTPRRLNNCRNAILTRDFDALADVIEEDCLLMHAVMMTSRPALFYWLPETMMIMEEVRRIRKTGIPAAFTIDAGANVHVITTKSYADSVRQAFNGISAIQKIISSSAGGAARLIE